VKRFGSEKFLPGDEWICKACWNGEILNHPTGGCYGAYYPNKRIEFWTPRFEDKDGDEMKWWIHSSTGKI
jgi:hypothetical protein